MKLDLEKYLPMMEEWDMSLDEKTEWLEALNLIMVHFVDMAFDPNAIDVSDDETGGDVKF